MRYHLRSSAQQAKNSAFKRAQSSSADSSFTNIDTTGAPPPSPSTTGGLEILSKVPPRSVRSRAHVDMDTVPDITRAPAPTAMPATTTITNPSHTVNPTTTPPRSPSSRPFLLPYSTKVMIHPTEILPVALGLLFAVFWIVCMIHLIWRTYIRPRMHPGSGFSEPDHTNNPHISSKLGSKRLQKAKPAALKLRRSNFSDLEAQPARSKASAEQYQNPFSPSPASDKSLNAFIHDVESHLKRNGKASAVDCEDLTPFTPARARARRAAGQNGPVAMTGSGDIGGGNAYEGDNGRGRPAANWERQLDEYFFEDGVGVKRYTTTGAVRGWKDE